MKPSLSTIGARPARIARSSVMGAVAVALAIHALAVIVILRHDATPSVDQPETAVEIQLDPRPLPTPTPTLTPTPAPARPVAELAALQAPARHTSGAPAFQMPRPGLSSAGLRQPAVALSGSPAASPVARAAPRLAARDLSAGHTGDVALATTAPGGAAFVASPSPALSDVTGDAPAAGSDGWSAGTGAGTGTARPREGATAPQLLRAVDSESVYPTQARGLGIEGDVQAVLDIDAAGSVARVRIARPAGHGLDDAAAAALKQFRFRPARDSDGRPVPARLRWTYVFQLKD